jgi:GTPase SAR1 family protein
MFYQQAAGAVLVFDLTNTTSFSELDGWLSEFQANAPSNCPVVLAGNKCDAVDVEEIDLDPVEQFAELRSLSFFFTSALTGQNVKETIDALVALIPKRELRVDTTPIEEVPEDRKGCRC